MRPGLGQLLHHCLNMLLGFRIGFFEKKLPDQADAGWLRLGQSGGIVRDRLRRAHRVVGIFAGQGLKQQGRICHGTGKNPHMVQTARQGIDAVGANPAKGRLEADAAAIGGRTYG